MMNQDKSFIDIEGRAAEQEGSDQAESLVASDALPGVDQGSSDGREAMRTLAARIKELEQRVERLARENESLKSAVHEEQMLRIREQATLQRDKNSFEARTKLSLFLDLLAVVDSFQQLVKHGEGTQDNSGLAIGSQAVLAQLNQFLARNGVHKIEGLEGKPYDSSTSEIAHVVADSDAPSNTVIQVLRDGYRLDDMLLRPAMVDVSGAAEQENEAESSIEDQRVDSNQAQF